MHMFRATWNGKTYQTIAVDERSALKNFISYTQSTRQQGYVTDFQKCDGGPILHQYACQIVFGPYLGLKSILSCAVLKDADLNVYMSLKEGIKRNSEVYNFIMTQLQTIKVTPYIHIRLIRIFKHANLVWSTSAISEELCALFERFPYRQQSYAISQEIVLQNSKSEWVERRRNFKCVRFVEPS
jgi:hypothetical protein